MEILFNYFKEVCSKFLNPKLLFTSITTTIRVGNGNILSEDELIVGLTKSCYVITYRK